MKKLLLILTILLFASPAWGATYYYADDGKEVGCPSADWADPCQDISPNGGGTGLEDDWASISVGDTILLACGDTWSPDLAAYYDGKLDIPKKIILGAFDKTDGSRITTGNTCGGATLWDDLPTLDQNTLQIPGVENDKASVMVEFADATDDSIIEFIHLTDGCGHAIVLANDDDANAGIHTIQYMKFSDIGGAAITGGNNNEGVLSYNYMTEMCRLWTDDGNSKAGCDTEYTDDTSGWPGLISPGYNGSYTIQGNYGEKTEGKCEGIHYQNQTVVGNVFYNHRNLAFYGNVGSSSGGGTSILRYNVAIGTNDGTYCVQVNSGGRDWCSTGVGLADESASKTSTYYIYGNIIIGYYYGLTSKDSSTGAGSNRTAYIYNNTFIDNKFNFRLEDYSNATITYTIRNNLSVVYDASAGHTSVDGLSAGGPWTGYTINTNGWHDEQPEVAGFYDSGTDTVGDAKLPRTTGWQTLAGIPETVTELLPGAGSMVFGNAADVGTSSDNCVANITAACGVGDDTDFTASPPSIELIDRDDSQWDLGAFSDEPPGIADEASMGGS
jgi:hypothetical protein